MKVNVKFFGIFQEAAQTQEVKIEIKKGTRVNELYHQILSSFPEKKRFPRVLFAVNQDFVKSSQTLKEGDELSLIPPMSGG